MNMHGMAASRIPSAFRPAGQVIPAGFVFSCIAWARMSYAQKYAKAATLAKFFSQGMTVDAAVKALDAYCLLPGVPVVSGVNFYNGKVLNTGVRLHVRPAGKIMPAGQSYGDSVGLDANGNPIDSVTGNPIPNAVAVNSQGQPVDVNGNVLNMQGGFVNPNNLAPGTYNPATNTIVGSTPSTTPSSTPSSFPPSGYSAIAAGLNTTASTISQVMQSQNQLAMANLAAQNQQYLAGLQAQLQLSPNNPQVLAQIQQSQLLAQQLAMNSQQGTNTTILIGVGILALAGVFIFTSMNKGRTTARASARHNPVVTFPRRRYVSAKHLRRMRGRY